MKVGRKGKRVESARKVMIRSVEGIEVIRRNLEGMEMDGSHLIIPDLSLKLFYYFYSPIPSSFFHFFFYSYFM